ncbi:MAG: Lrp/AsnC ligand binding domain-containing protein [Candidatus Thermoplasmatota archaeon]
MTTGFVLVASAPSKELDVFGKLLKLDGVVEVWPVLGPIDFIVRVEAENHEQIAEIVLRNIRTILGVTSTKTFVEDEFLRHLKMLAE